MTVGTMALRTAKNAADLVSAVQSLSGIGALAGRLAVCDVGGGSTEFIFAGDAGIDRRFSINLGAAKVSDEYLASELPGPEQVGTAMSFVLDTLRANRVDAARPVDRLIGISGTVTSMGSVKLKMGQYDPDLIQGAALTRNDVDELIRLFCSMSLGDQRKIVGLKPKRAEVIIGGVCIVRGVMQCLGVTELTMLALGSPPVRAEKTSTILSLCGMTAQLLAGPAN